MLGFRQIKIVCLITATALLCPQLLADDASLVSKQAQLKQRKQSLELQYQKLQQTLAEEDSFSPNLAEDYLSYGLLLKEDDQLEQAIEVLEHAAHIKKVNNGIYSSQQLPALKAQFQIHRTLGNEKAIEETIKHILFVERKNPKGDEDISYDLLVDLGHDYLNSYYQLSGRSQRKMEALLSAKYYLSTALSKYHKKKGIKTSDLPYGELAMISYLQAVLGPPPEGESFYDQRDVTLHTLAARQKMRIESYHSDLYRDGVTWLQHYSLKAKKQNESAQEVRANLAIADFNLLSGKGDPFQYYRQAWEKAQFLEQTEAEAINFEKPVALPKFNYLKPIQSTKYNPRYSQYTVPVKLTISPKGKVIGVEQTVFEGELAEQFSKAKSVVRKVRFRPKIVDGQAVAAEGVDYKVTVNKRNKN